MSGLEQACLLDHWLVLSKYNHKLDKLIVPK